MKKKKKKTQKRIQVSYNIGQHDLDTKKRQTKKFLEKGLDVHVQMMLKGREKYLYTDASEKLEQMFKEFKIINKWQKGNFYNLLLRQSKS